MISDPDLSFAWTTRVAQESAAITRLRIGKCQGRGEVLRNFLFSDTLARLAEEARVTVLSVGEPPKREAGVKVADIPELVEKLKNEAKVI